MTSLIARLWRWLCGGAPGLTLEEFRRRANTWHGWVPGSWRRVLLSEPCVYCGGVPTGLDHIHPRSQGGDDGWTNRAPACRPCDLAKGKRHMLLFLTQGLRPGTKAARRKQRHLQRRTVRAMVLEARKPPVLMVSMGEAARWTSPRSQRERLCTSQTAS